MKRFATLTAFLGLATVAKGDGHDDGTCGPCMMYTDAECTDANADQDALDVYVKKMKADNQFTGIDGYGVCDSGRASDMWTCKETKAIKLDWPEGNTDCSGDGSPSKERVTVGCVEDRDATKENDNGKTYYRNCGAAVQKYLDSLKPAEEETPEGEGDAGEGAADEDTATSAVSMAASAATAVIAVSATLF